MNLTEKFAERIREVMRRTIGTKVDYWDVRFGDSGGTRIRYRNKDLEELSFPKSFGGSVRVLFRGGWGFVTISDIDELETAAGSAWEYARLVGKNRFKLAPVPVVKELVKAEGARKDFLGVETGEKVRVLDHFRDCIWSSPGNVTQSILIYNDSMSVKLFVSSEGSVIEQEKPRLRVMVEVTAMENSVVQSKYENLSFTNFAGLKGKESKVTETVDIVNRLVAAPPTCGGEMTVVMDNAMSGVFAHEAFGHLSEGDNVESDEQLQKIMVLGKRFGSRKITIYDDPTAEGWGGYKYDDEGVRSCKAVLLEKGVLVGRLHNRSTAGRLGEKPTGHGRAASTKDRPIVRMGTTVIETGTSGESDLFAGIKKGVYCVDWNAGMTDYENYTFAAGYGYEVENGKLGRLVRDVKLKGNTFETLKHIEAVGRISAEEPGMCGKLGQNLPVSQIAPTIRIGKVMVMGV